MLVLGNYHRQQILKEPGGMAHLNICSDPQQNTPRSSTKLHVCKTGSGAETDSLLLQALLLPRGSLSSWQGTRYHTDHPCEIFWRTPRSLEGWKWATEHKVAQQGRDSGHPVVPPPLVLFSDFFFFSPCLFYLVANRRFQLLSEKKNRYLLLKRKGCRNDLYSG